ncbi:MAG TPA: nucleoside transporter C-terminal domain-containing protein [Myxococcota bacterium]|nr:nucleoside transporter C-terminal domain-containing protein [Myxococcota bacterium]
MNDLALRALSGVGLVVMIGLAWVASTDRTRFPWRTVAWGLGGQLALALLLLRTPVGHWFFSGVDGFARAILSVTETASRFMFGSLYDVGPSFLMSVFPIIIFMGSLYGVLYHLGVIQVVIRWLARGLTRTMRLSGAESLAAVANIFVGMAEAALLVRPYVEGMTRSELFTLMTTGMATVAGSVLFAYVAMLGGGDYAGHLVTASLMSAPAAILIAKVVVPEHEAPKTAGHDESVVTVKTVNVIDAAAGGAIDGLRLGAFVGAMLIAFVALVALMNGALSLAGGLVGIEGLTFQRVLGTLLAPLAFVMGIPWSEAPTVGSLLGIKTVLNEFLAYQELGVLVAGDAISERSAIIASYALCGFANFGSLAILIGAIGAVAPARRPDMARLGLLSILSGSLATFMTGCIAGLLI